MIKSSNVLSTGICQITKFLLLIFITFFLWRKSIANQMYTLSIVAWRLVKQQCFFLSGKKVIVPYNHIHQVCFYSLKYLYSLTLHLDHNKHILIPLAHLCKLLSFDGYGAAKLYLPKVNRSSGAAIDMWIKVALTFLYPFM